MTQIELIIGELSRSYGASTAPVKAHTEKDRGERMASERTACDRLVGRLVSYGEPEGFGAGWGWGCFYEGYLLGEAARELPVEVFKKWLVAHGLAGQFDRHL